jgi:hypothetical protein
LEPFPNTWRICHLVMNLNSPSTLIRERLRLQYSIQVRVSFF